jgi:hypothetical protein
VVEVPFKDPMEDAVKVAIKTGVAETKTKRLKTSPSTVHAIAGLRWLFGHCLVLSSFT